MSGWWKSLPNGLPNVVSLPKSGHRRAGKGREFPWRCNVDTIAMDLKVSWEMSVQRTMREAPLSAKAGQVDSTAMMLSTYTDKKTGTAWPSVPTLAADTSLSRRTVQRDISAHYTELREKGWTFAFAVGPGKPSEG